MELIVDSRDSFWSIAKKKITVLSFLPFHHVFYVLDNWHAWHIVQIQAMFWHYFQGCFFAVGTCFIKQYISCKIFKAVVFWSAQQKKKKKKLWQVRKISLWNSSQFISTGLFCTCLLVLLLCGFWCNTLNPFALSFNFATVGAQYFHVLENLPLLFFSQPHSTLHNVALC